MAKIVLPPFPLDRELTTDEKANQSLRCQLVAATSKCGLTKDDIKTYLQKEIHTPVLDELFACLWLVARKSSTHIDALHQHRVKKRHIVLAEDPGLHLVWHYDTVYLKPLPPALLSHSFWQKHLLPKTAPSAGQDSFDVDCISDDCRVSLGFLRSYSHLILHESDFHIAQEAHLITKEISYLALQQFLSCFRYLSDDVVSQRYLYGQFRLTRLNWAVRIYRPKSSGRRLPWNYQERYWQTGQHLARFGGPLLFFFAVTSLVLSAMQVVLGALGSETWEEFVRASWGFSIAVLLLSVGIVVSALLGVFGLLLNQAQFALRMYWRELFANKSSKV